jgi:hypothetical protein
MTDLPRRVLRRLAAPASAAAAVVFLAIPASPAVAGTAPAPWCTARYTCMFQGSTFDGAEQDYYNPDNGGSWVYLPVGGRASVVEAGASDVWFWNRAAGLYTCVAANNSSDDLSFPGGAGFPGFMYVDYGVNQGCSEATPAGAPGT